MWLSHLIYESLLSAVGCEHGILTFVSSRPLLHDLFCPDSRSVQFCCLSLFWFLMKKFWELLSFLNSCASKWHKMLQITGLLWPCWLIGRTAIWHMWKSCVGLLPTHGFFTCHWKLPADMSLLLLIYVSSLSVQPSVLPSCKYFCRIFLEISSGSEEAEVDEDGVFKRKGRTIIWVSVYCYWICVYLADSPGVT